MINSVNPRQGQIETPFDHIEDVNELILAARAALNITPAVPMDEEAQDAEEDAAMDLLGAALSRWIILLEPVPVDSKERLTQITESMIDCLRRIQSLLPDHPETLKKDLRHMLRRQLAGRKRVSE